MKRNVLYLISFFTLDQIPKIKNAIWLQVNILRWLKGGGGLLPRMLLTLRRQLRMVPLIMMLLLWIKRIKVVRESRLREQVSLNKKQKRCKRCSGFWNIPLFCTICWNLLLYSHRSLTRSHSRSSSTIYMILGHGQSGGIGEEPPVTILMLIS